MYRITVLFTIALILFGVVYAEINIQKTAEQIAKEEKKWFDWGKGKAQDAYQQAGDMVGKVSDSASDLSRHASQRGEQAAERANFEAGKLSGQAEDSKQGWLNWGQAKATDAKETAGDLVDKAKAELSHHAQTASDKAEQARLQAKLSKESWFNWGKDKAHEASNQAGAMKDMNAEQIQRAKETMAGVKDQAVDSAQANADAMKQQASQVKNRAAEMAQRAQQGMKEGAEAMKTAAADAVQSTKSAATGASQSAQTAASDAAQSAQDTGSWINKKVKENL